MSVHYIEARGLPIDLCRRLPESLTRQIAHSFPHETISYSVQPAECTTFEDDAFDLVNVAQALHWLELDPFWTEVQRVLRPHGTFVAYCYAWSYIDRQIDAVIEHCIRQVVSPYWAPNNRICWDGYKSLDFPFERLETPAFCIENRWDIDQLFDYIHTWSAVRRCMEETGSEFFDAAKSEATAFWGKPTDKKLVRTPLTVVAGNAW